MNRFQYQESERAFMEHSPIPFAIYQFLDRRVVTLALSDGFRRLFGYEDRAEAYWLMDNDMYRDTHPDDTARIAEAAYRFAVEGGEYNVIYRTRVGDAYIIVHASGRHIYKEDGTRLAVVWYNDEGRYEETAGHSVGSLNASLSSALHRETLYHSNYYDNLTGLPSMTYFFELAEAGRQRLREEGEVPAFLFINLSGMKFFNQKYGFAQGDLLLDAFSKVLVRQFSNENCSRFGQDHFAVFAAAGGLEEKLQAVFAEAGEMNEGKTLPVRAGIYLDRDGTEDVALAIDKASYACDDLKGSYGSGYVYFSDSMLSTAENRQYIIDNIDRAIREQWIQVYYQPIIRATNGRVCDEEALARWFDPVKGFLSPGEFIPVLESARLIRKLDLYVLDQVLKKMKGQQDAGLYVVPQSLNLSRADFEAGDIVEDIRSRVDAAGIPRGKLTIEITESMVGQDFDFMKEQVERFRGLGFQVWMDDFGSGYSSLDLLQNIRFDLIKFDMRFMEQFQKGNESRIILTELMKMTLALGIDTVAEGVETEAQADFLKEVGCTKLQGFYFCKPIPREEIVERIRKGIQIGYENPAETDYYAALGRINLYDPISASIEDTEDSETLRRYFDTVPSAILECDETDTWIVRCSRSYKDFMERAFGMMQIGMKVPFAAIQAGPGSAFMKAVAQCRKEGRRIFIEEEIGDGAVAHAVVRHVAVNPVTGVTACVVVMLGIMDTLDRGVTYTRIAQALSADYINLYYVDLDTEQFVEYRPNQEELGVEQHGEDFFAASRRDALRLVYQEDREEVLRSFTRESVLDAIESGGTFTLTYRLLIRDEPVYVNMKAVRMGDNHLIIGVNNVDAQMRQKEVLEKARQAQLTYARINALSGDYLAIYLVDPETDHYTESSATLDYEGLGLAKAGEDFFRKSKEDSLRAIYAEDHEMFASLFSKENILAEIRRHGRFTMRYRLLIEEEPVYVTLRAALLEENGRSQLIVGVSRADAPMKQALEYGRMLNDARSEAAPDLSRP